jgi:PAS domain-containing protein
MNTSSNAVRGAETATEQLQLELERLRSELDRCATRLQLTEKLLEHVADAVFVADLDGRIIDVNARCWAMKGRSCSKCARGILPQAPRGKEFLP